MIHHLSDDGEMQFRSEVGGRALLSLPPSPNEITTGDTKLVKNASRVTPTDTDVLPQPPANTTTQKVPIDHCMPGDFFYSRRKPVSDLPFQIEIF